jgi:transposase-like protein
METVSTEVIIAERKRDMRGHRLYSDERRLALIVAYQRSGLTQKALARREGIKHSTFTAWLQRRCGATRRAKEVPPPSGPMRFTDPCHRATRNQSSPRFQERRGRVPRCAPI